MKGEISAPQVAPKGNAIIIFFIQKISFSFKIEGGTDADKDDDDDDNKLLLCYS